jgi:hypothetical protein
MASMYTTTTTTTTTTNNNNNNNNNSMQDEKENRVLNHRLGDARPTTTSTNGTRRHNHKPQSSPQNGVPSSLTKLEELKQRLQASRNQRGASASLVSSAKTGSLDRESIQQHGKEERQSFRSTIAAAEREKNKKNQTTTTPATTATTTSRDNNQLTPVQLDRESQPNPYETAAPLLSATHSTNTTFRDLFGTATEEPDAKEEEEIMERLSPTSTTTTTTSGSSSTTSAPIRKSVSFAASYESTVAPIETAFQQNSHTVIVDVEGGTSTNTKLTMNHHDDHEFTKAYLLLVCLGVLLFMGAGAAIGVAVNAAFFG